MAQACIFCSIVSGELPATKVYEDARHVAFFPLEQINLGHLLLVPKDHTDYLFDIPHQAYLELWSVASRIAQALRSVTDAKRVGVAVEGFSVPHAHIHLVPVNHGNELNPMRTTAVSPTEIGRLAALLRAELDA